MWILAKLLFWSKIFRICHIRWKFNSIWKYGLMATITNCIYFLKHRRQFLMKYWINSWILLWWLSGNKPNTLWNSNQLVEYLKMDSSMFIFLNVITVIGSSYFHTVKRSISNTSIVSAFKTALINRTTWKWC